MTQRSSKVLEFLTHQPLGMFINGKFSAAQSSETFDVLDPGSGQLVAKVAAGGKADVDRAVAAADRAFRESGWATMKPADRSRLLHRLADLIDKHADALAEIESLDVGKPIAQPKAFDVPHVALTLRYYADLMIGTERTQPIDVAGYEAKTLRVPYGVCGFVLPWNFPFLLVGWGASPALAAGNTIVIKPAEDTPLSTLYFCKLVKEAGIPDGVVNVVTGYGHTAGAALADHPGIARMSFTGSPEVGRKIAEACGRNLVPVKLELGGKGAAVLFDDINVPAAAKALASAITLNSGQVCCTATRWVVHKSIMEEFVSEAIDNLNAVVIGHGADSMAQMGPVVSAKQRDRVLGYLERGKREGATALLDGGLARVNGQEGGFYVKPFLLTGSADNICAREEIFGPAAYVIPFSDEDEAVSLVNQSRYGLANSVWSRNLERAGRVAQSLVAGNSWINAHNVFAHGVPYGGCNLSGCGGGVLGPDTLFDYLRGQSIVRSLG